MASFDPKMLADPDPAARVASLRQLRYADLKDPSILAVVLAAVGDTTPVAAATAADPFAAFFGGGATTGTVGAAVAERLERTGLPGDRTSVDVLVAALASTAAPLPSVVARAIGVTPFVDRDDALRALVPALDAHEQPLYEAIGVLPSAVTPTLAALAVDPWRPRLFQELLNHPPSRDLAIAAVLGVPLWSATDAVDVLTVLAGWGDASAGILATALADEHPFAIAFRAPSDPAAYEGFAAWVNAGCVGPARVCASVAAVLRQRGVPPGFPLALLLTALDDDAGLLEELAEPDVSDATRALLEQWVKAHATAPSPRGWAAIRCLVAAGQHSDVLPALSSAVERDGEHAIPLVATLLRSLAAADPPVPGFAEALAKRVAEEPDRLAEVVPVVSGLGPTAVRQALVAVLDAADAAPRIEEAAGRGVIRERCAGVDVDAVVSWVEALADAALTARFEARRSVIRGGPPSS